MDVLTINKMLKDVIDSRANAKKDYQQAWLDGAEIALLSVGQPIESIYGVAWNNDISRIGGTE